MLLDDGYTYSEVSAILRLDDSTVRRHESAYKIKGMKEYIKNPFSGGICKLEADQLKELELYVDENLCEIHYEF